MSQNKTKTYTDLSDCKCPNLLRDIGKSELYFDMCTRVIHWIYFVFPEGKYFRFY